MCRRGLVVLLCLVAGSSAYLSTHHKAHHVGLFGGQAKSAHQPHHSSHHSSHHSLEEVHWLAETGAAEAAKRSLDAVILESNARHHGKFFTKCLTESLRQDIYSKHIQPHQFSADNLITALNPFAQSLEKKERTALETLTKDVEVYESLGEEDINKLLNLFDTRQTFLDELDAGRKRCQLAVDLIDLGTQFRLPETQRTDALDRKQITKDLERERFLTMGQQPVPIEGMQDWITAAENTVRLVLGLDGTAPVDEEDVWLILHAAHRTYNDDAVISLRKSLLLEGYMAFPFPGNEAIRIKAEEDFAEVLVLQHYYVMRHDPVDYIPFKLTAMGTTSFTRGVNRNTLHMSRREGQVVLTLLTDDEREFVEERAEGLRPI